MRNEAIEVITNLQIPKSKLSGVTEIYEKSIDVISKSRDGILEVFWNFLESVKQ